MRSLMLVAVAALAFATAASADPQGPFRLDKAGKCHDATGKFVPPGLCHITPWGPHCKPPHKLCGRTCIAAAKTCHV